MGLIRLMFLDRSSMDHNYRPTTRTRINMKELVQGLERISNRITIEQTDYHFTGDCVVKFCGVAPTVEEVGHLALMFGRNDENNPRYHHGRFYMFQYLSNIFRENVLEYEKNIRYQILDELEQSENISKLLELKQELL